MEVQIIGCECFSCKNQHDKNAFTGY